MPSVISKTRFNSRHLVIGVTGWAKWARQYNGESPNRTEPVSAARTPAGHKNLAATVDPTGRPVVGNSGTAVAGYSAIAKLSVSLAVPGDTVLASSDLSSRQSPKDSLASSKLTIATQEG